MNKPIKRKKRASQNVVDDKLIAQAEALKSQGVNAFGDPNMKFSVTQDMAAMKEVGMPIVDTVDNNSIDYEAIAKQEIRDEVSVEEAVQFAKEKEKITNPEAQEEEGPIQLSDDPIERLGQVAELYQKTDKNFPSKEVLVKWKQMHGGLFLLDLDDKVFLYRYLKRAEVIQLELDESFQKLRPDQQQDAIFNKCVLFPRLDPTQMAMLPGGVVASIVETIHLKSMFFDPRQLAMATVKL